MTVRSLAMLFVALSGCVKASTDATHSAPTSSESSTHPGSAPASSASAPSSSFTPPARGDDTDRKSKNGSLSATVNGVPLIVQYGRPQVSGRKIFGELIPLGEIWRTGADEATTLTLQKPAIIAGQPAEAGTYALFTIPEEKGWTLVLNSKAKQWGAYKHDPALDVLKVKVNVEMTEASTEALTFSATDDAIICQWEHTKAIIPIASK